MKKFILIGVAVLLSGSVFAGRKMNLVKISSGSKFNDMTKSTKQVLDDKVAGGISLKVTLSKDGSVGVYNPKIRNWSKADKLVLQIMNPSDNMLSFDLVIFPKDLKGKSRYNGRSDNKFILKPGMNKIEMDLGDFTDNSGDPLDLKNIVQFYMTPSSKSVQQAGGKVVIYVKKIYLEFD